MDPQTPTHSGLKSRVSVAGREVLGPFVTRSSPYYLPLSQSRAHLTYLLFVQYAPSSCVHFNALGHFCLEDVSEFLSLVRVNNFLAPLIPLRRQAA